MLVRRPAAVLAALGSLALAACFTISFELDSGASGSMRIELGAISPDCVDADATDGVQVTLEGDQCHIVVDWSGTVIDMAKAHDQAAQGVEDNGQSPADVFLTIERATVTVRHISLVGSNDSPVSPAPMLSQWAGSVMVAGAPIVDVSGTNTAVMLSNPIAVELDEGVIADLQTAFERSRPVRGSAHAELVVGVDTLRALSSVNGAALLLDYDVAMTIEAATEI